MEQTRIMRRSAVSDGMGTIWDDVAALLGFSEHLTFNWVNEIDNGAEKAGARHVSPGGRRMVLLIERGLALGAGCRIGQGLLVRQLPKERRRITNRN
ncbi:unnamed protein product, partial [Iphiclides podalirius]